MLALRHLVLGATALMATLSIAWASDAPPSNPFRHAQRDVTLLVHEGTAETIDQPDSVDPNRRAIQRLTVDISLPSGKVPENVATTPVATHALAGDLPRPWPTQVYQWQAAATRHQPLYFEEINAERYGYSRNWVCQPVVSTAHFFATIPALPYLKAANCPWECQYTLGHYRPGSCPPYRHHCWPVDGLGAATELGTAAWLVLVLP